MLNEQKNYKANQLKLNNEPKTIYCHFSFKRPKGKNYGLFAVAFYWDRYGKMQIKKAQATRKLKLWHDHQWITSIQSYEHALYSIYVLQGMMKAANIDNVMLVTDNSVLANWILEPKKNKTYAKWMNKAVEKYRVGGINELTVGVGLYDVVDYEKAYKYCKEERVINEKEFVLTNSETNQSVIDIKGSGMQFHTISELEENNPNTPSLSGIEIKTASNLENVSSIDDEDDFE